ncbi:classical arabinogalactan protein 4-like [Salvia miltiorrhiza]|uniref:classical arabinogalactan protein 4-like n=1 Tax=Salvia miltiorrhiza TaxID=226208 RepID=UPI0025AC2E6D|nr:classical arabinogalactan protein 4-like [Salvia miltiorrhiza]
MASIIIHSLSLTIFFALLFFPNPTFSADVPESSPSPSPMAPAPSPVSPPAPPPSRLSPDSPSPAPSPADEVGDSSNHKESPSPAPIAAADAGQGDKMHLGDLDHGDDSEGMSGGKKAGIAMGVIAAGCVVGIAAVVYKKRQQNIRRAQYSYTDRRDFM